MILPRFPGQVGAGTPASGAAEVALRDSSAGAALGILDAEVTLRLATGNASPSRCGAASVEEMEAVMPVIRVDLSGAAERLLIPLQVRAAECRREAPLLRDGKAAELIGRLVRPSRKDVKLARLMALRWGWPEKGAAATAPPVESRHP